MGANIKIESESKQFITEMKQVTDNLKLVDSTLSVATEKAKLFGNAQEQLQAKQAQLSNKLQSGNKILDLQGKALTELANDVDKYKARNSELAKSINDVESKLKEQIKLTGEDSKETRDLQQSLNKLQNEYNANDKAIDRTNSSMDKYKLKMNEVEKAILQDTKALEELNRTPSKMDKVNNGIDNTKSKLTSLRNAFFGITTTLAGGFGLVKFTEGAIEAGDNAYTLSQKMHLSTTEATQLNRILSITNTDTKPLISTMTNLDKAVGKAGVTEDKNNQKLQETINKNNAKIATLEKSKKITDEVRQKIQGLKDENEDYSAELKANQEAVGANSSTLQKYGIKLTDAQGKFLPINEQLQRLSDAYKKASDSGQDEAFVADVLGAKGAQLVPLLEQYTEAKEEASKVKGIGIDPKQAHETQEQLKVLKMQVAATGGVMAKSLIPLVQAILPPLIVLFQKLTEQIKSHKADLDVFIKNVVDIGKSIGAVLIPIVSTLFNFIVQHGQTAKLIIVAIGTSFLGLQTVVGTLKTVNNAVTTFKDSMDNAKKAADLLKTGVGFLGDGFNVIKGAISGGIGAVVNFGKATGEALINVGKMTLELAAQAGSWIAQKLALVASTIATGVMTAAQAALNFVMSLNPLTLIIIGLTALVAGLVYAYNKVDWFRNMVNGAFTAVKNTAIWVFNGIKDFLVNWGAIILIPVMPFLGIPLTIMQHWNQIKEFFSNLGSWLKQKLHDMFSFELPHIKLPHFSLTGEFSLSKGTIPHLGVEWYAKGGIMTQPTVFGMNGNNAMVGGEAGAEAVLPLQQLWSQLDKNFDRLEQRLNVNKQQIFVIQGQDIYMDGQKVGRVTSKYVNQEMAWNG